MLANVEVLAKAAHDETGLGRYEDKVVKNRLVTERTPGLEELSPMAVTGDRGLTLTEPAPFGVIGAITPSTNPTSTIICNAIGMLAAGNSVVFCVHPLAKQCSMMTVTLLNKAITERRRAAERRHVPVESQHRRRRAGDASSGHPAARGHRRRRRRQGGHGQRQAGHLRGTW